MSPQAAVSLPAHYAHRVSLVESDNSFLSSLIEAADEAYQKTSDESTSSSSSVSAPVHAGPGRMTTSSNHPINSTNAHRPARFNLRKRKVVSVSGTSCAGSLAAVNSAFLSGLFADLEQTTAAGTSFPPSAPHATAEDEAEEHYVTDGESCPNSPVPSPKKRPRLGRTLSRCTKSYASLSGLGASSTYNSTDSYVDGKFSGQKAATVGTSTAPALPADEDLLATAGTAPSAVASDVLADSLCAAAALADAIFPHLPATVSDSPLRKTSHHEAYNAISADLTAQPASSTEVPTAGHHADPLHVEPEMTLEEVFAPTLAALATGVGVGVAAAGPASAAVTPTDADRGESYGWYLDLDTDVDASEEHITDAYDGNHNHESSASSLAFQVPVSAAASSHEAEVEWAKAADTVDDVLGDLPF
mmetsp:Transcript_25273/g.73122  ORF Transcript_25273/g.73122 Transcript_25273/m.73122 type:complete len:417 (+) Transcript_25273:87-1337(+)